MGALQNEVQKITLKNGEIAEIVDVSINTQYKRSGEIDSLLETFKRNKNEVVETYTDEKTYIQNNKTWIDFLDECLLVSVSIIKEGSQVLKGDKQCPDGKPIWGSVREYINSVGSYHPYYYTKVKEYRYNCMPPIDELTYDQSISIITKLLSQKKNIEQILDSLDYFKLRSFTTTLAKEHAILHQKNLQHTLFSKKQEK